MGETAAPGCEATAQDLEERRYLHTSKSFEGMVKVDGLFDSIASLQGQNPHEIDVDYDASLGYPVMISVDVHKDYVDDEFTVRISSFITN